MRNSGEREHEASLRLKIINEIKLFNKRNPANQLYLTMKQLLTLDKGKLLIELQHARQTVQRGQAASKIQAYWRMRKIKLLYHEYLLKVVRIQHFVRRMIAFKWQSPNKIQRKAATQIQKYLRGYIVNKHTSIVYERAKLARLL